LKPTVKTYRTVFSKEYHGGSISTSGNVISQASESGGGSVKRQSKEAISKVFKNGRKFLLRSANGAFSACPP